MKLLKILPFLLVFIASLYRPNDSDLGWHLKYGEYFFQRGEILRENTFSLMMSDYHWVNSSWGTDLISFITFNNFGFLGLAVLSALIVTLTFYFFAKAASLNLWEQAMLFPILLYFEQPVNSVSFRGQQITFLFLGILFYILSRYQKSKSKIILLTLPLFTIWVNIHGEYLLGLVIFLLWIMVYLGEQIIFQGKRIQFLKGEVLLLGSIYVLSILATLINPFGVGVYQETARHFFNPWQKYIAEWLPFSDLSTLWWNHIVIGVLILGSIISLFFTDKLQRNFPYLALVILLFALSFMMRRYAWPLYYMTLLLFKPLATLLKPPDRKIEMVTITAILCLSSLVVATFKMPFGQYKDMNWDIYCQIRGCSAKASEFLINKKLNNDKLLTVYDWGGWLIWNYPKIKPTIDGRMHLWADEKGNNAFGQYYPIEQNWEDVDKSSYEVAYVSTSKPIYDRLLELVDEGKWKLLYSDQSAGIFVRN